MKVAIVGSRAYPRLDKVREYVWSLPIDTTIVSGGARGVDITAADAAHYRKMPVIVFLPDWDTHGKSAGFRRNKQIVDEADMVVAFWDGKSKGTVHSINLAKKAGKECVVFGVEP